VFEWLRPRITGRWQVSIAAAARSCAPTQRRAGPSAWHYACRSLL